MEITRKFRVEYFKVVIAKIGSKKDKDFDLSQLIAKVDNTPIKERKFKYYQEDARLDKLYYEKSTGYWYLNFLRLRQTKLPLTAKENELSEGMELGDDEYIGEDVTGLYDCKTFILALQRNRDSLSATGIEHYLTELYNNKDYGIYLRPILDKNVDDKLLKSNVFRKITLKFATDTSRIKKIIPNTSFARLNEYLNKFDAKSAIMTISMGREKGSLDSDTIHNTLNEIRKSEDFVTGAELRVKYNEIDPVDTIDLFTMKYFDTIRIKIEKRETIDYKVIGEEICIKYNSRKKELIKAM